jgi:hypothetical protein
MKLRHIFALLSFLSCGSAALANLIQFAGTAGAPPGTIAFVAAADLGNGTGASYTSSAHSVTAGSTELQLCVVGDFGSNADDISTVSYGGSSATQSTKQGGGNRWLYLYHLESPPSGSHTVTITGGNHYWAVMVAEYSGAATAGQPDATITASVTANSITTNVTTVADNSWVVSCEEGYNASQAPSAGAGATQRVVDASFNSSIIVDSNGPVHPAGSYSQTINSQGGASIPIVMVTNSIKP